MIEAMKAIMKLFLVLAEEDKTVDQVLPLADRLFHNECRMTIDGDILNKPRILSDMKSLVDKKVIMELSKVEEDEFGIIYDYTIQKPLERPVKKLAKAMVRDGQIYHVDIFGAEASVDNHNPKLRRATAPIIHGF